MKNIITEKIFLAVLVVIIMSCTKSPAYPEYTGERVEVTFTYNKRSGLSSNQFVVWIEKENGDYVKTLFATKATVKKLYEKRPFSLLNWRKKADIQTMSSEVIDSFSGATPKAKTQKLKYSWNITDTENNRLPNGIYRVYVEGTIYSEHNVVYSALITVGGGQVDVIAIPNYSSEKAKTSNMIEGVIATYYQN